MTEWNILITTAISIAFIHTLIGVDHYVPFIALSRANNWSMRKTQMIVLVCGIGHVMSSVALGFAGIGLAAGVSMLVDIESIRGEIATWFLIAFGVAYMVYGIRRALKNKTHSHVMPNGSTYMHIHNENEEGHEHKKRGGRRETNTLWGLFILFILGPCEPLIPLLMYPAATHNTSVLITVTAVFAACTISTMLLMTFLGIKGIGFLKTKKLERYTHALAGFAVLVCGLSVLLLPI